MADIEVTVNDKQLREFVKLTEQGANNIKVINGALSKEAGTTKEVDEALKRSVQVQKEVAKNWQETTRIITTQNDALIRSRLEKQRETAEAKKRIIIANAEKGSYEAINASLNKNIASWKRLSEAKRNNSAIGGKLIAQITKQDLALKKLDLTIGRSQRNVGNYASGFSGLNNSINQITRELPAFTYSMQTGFLAVSNNIPILVDQINNLKAANAELAKSGKPTVSIFSQLAKGVFSWQSLISIGVTLLTIYGAKIIEWVSAQIKGNRATDHAIELQKDLNKARKEGTSSAANELAKLDLLYKAVTNVNTSQDARKKAVEDLNRLYPGFLGNVDEDITKTKELALKYEELRKEIIKKAKAQALESVLGDYIKKQLELEVQKIEREEEYQKALEKSQKIAEQGGRAVKSQLTVQSRLTRVYKDDLQELDNQIEEYGKTIDKIASKIDLDALFGSPGSSSKGLGYVEKMLTRINMLLPEGSQLLSDYEKAWENVNKKSQTTIEDIINGNIKIKDSTNQLTSDFTSNWEGAYEKTRELMKNMGEESIALGKQYLVDSYAVQLDEQTSKFRDEQETKKGILQNRLDKGIISESEYNNELKKINSAVRKREAEADQKKALYSIKVNTAEAIIRTFAEFGWPAGILPAAVMGTIGVLQATAVKATPIPQYDKGKTNTPDTFIAGEKRPEFVRYRNGQVELLTQPTLFTQSRGMDVISSAETERMLSGKKDMPFVFDDSRIVGELKNQNSRPILKTEYTPDYVTSSYRKGNILHKRLKKI